jgi:uncharacterized protein (DUF486 family)
MTVIVKSALLLTLSNLFMTFAWYARLKNLSGKPWHPAALASWEPGAVYFIFKQ